LYHRRRIIHVVGNTSGPAALRLLLEDERASAIDPESVAELRGRLASADAGDLVTLTDDGGWTCWRRLPDGRRCRLLELDRSGNVVTLLGWGQDGTLRQAWIRLPTAGFVGIDAASRAAPSGRDQLRLAQAPGHAASSRLLGTFAALDYTALVEIPVLPEPGRLPPHAGTAVLNVLATLAADSRHDLLHYHGPYPTEALFLALLESFSYTPEIDNPLQAFIEGRLDWRPAPHTRWFTPEGAYVQRRGRVEKIVWRSRAYYRPDWQRVARHAPRRIHDEEGALCCSSWVLGQPLEIHLRLDTEGAVRDVPSPPPCSPTVRPFDEATARGIEGIVVAQSAPALATMLREVMQKLVLEWGPVDGELVRLTPERIRVSTRLFDTLMTMIRDAPTRESRLGLALVALTEIAALVGDDLRARAQTALLARPEAEQAHALTAAVEPPSAHVITAAVEALVRDAPGHTGGLEGPPNPPGARRRRPGEAGTPLDTPTHG
jgi:hypothetical protein